MYKLPRFNSYKQPIEAIPEETEPEGEWEQHVTLPMQKPEYNAYLKSKSEMLTKKNEEPSGDDVLNAEIRHRMYMIYVIMEAFGIDAGDFIEYLNSMQE